MTSISKIKSILNTEKERERLKSIYATSLSGTEHTVKRLYDLLDKFKEVFGYDEDSEVSVFSAPGRCEICGNHTDHQLGKVLAAGVNLDTLACACKNGKREVRIFSRGYGESKVNIDDLSLRPEEKNTTAALIRGILYIASKKLSLCGLDAYVDSEVPQGSGLSSSASFEVLLGVILSHFCFNDGLSHPEIAKMGQFAENEFFGKPSGLMDQMASSVGGFVYIDFKEKDLPRVKKIDFDFSKSGYALCVIDTHASHADLTPDYAAIPKEMKSIAAYFGKEVLSQVNENDFYDEIYKLREKSGDRAVLRAMHYYAENVRVENAVKALSDDDFKSFLNEIGSSGRSSFMYLQNVTNFKDPKNQPVSVALALAEHFLKGEGAVRIQGGGFAGTIEAFVPNFMLEDFRKQIDKKLGENSCHVLSIRPAGGEVLYFDISDKSPKIRDKLA